MGLLGVSGRSPMVDVGVRGCVKVWVAVSEDEKKQLYQENTKPKPHWPQHHELMNEPYTGRIRVQLVSRYHVTVNRNPRRVGKWREQRKTPRVMERKRAFGKAKAHI